MLKAFVLFMVMSAENNTYVITGDFNSIESCQNAMQSIIKESKGARVHLNKCYPK